jgi:hypothetical protein
MPPPGPDFVAVLIEDQPYLIRRCLTTSPYGFGFEQFSFCAGGAAEASGTSFREGGDLKKGIKKPVPRRKEQVFSEFFQVRTAIIKLR